MLLADKSPAEVHLMAHRACEELRSRLRSTARDHADRMRQLTDLMRKISSSDFGDGDTLGNIGGVSLSPDLEKLILNPTDGL